MTESDSAPFSRLLLYGSTGSIGAAIQDRFQSEGWQMIVVSRTGGRGKGYVQWDSAALGYKDASAVARLAAQRPF